ncbi:TetR family transcriptional regulator [Pseudomonas guineae]|uniref:TetR family transcriptional regulator n=1 Tax=Pseudomonas guineae TaxID=425504 RepID=UPI003D05E87A
MALQSCTRESALSRLEQIRHKALELFAERGFARFSMRDLALHVEIGCGPCITTLKEKSACCSS